MQAPLGQRLAAEFVGTLMLVLFGAGAVVAALYMGGGELTYAALGFISLSFAIAIAAAVYGFGPVSGGHINPAVTFSLAVTRRFSWTEVIPYWVAQLLGGAAGALLIVAAYGTGAVDLGGVGGTALAEGVSYGSGIAAEAIGTFILVFTVMALAVDPRAPRGWAGLMIGLAVACAIFVIGPLTGGSLNPARTFGPYIATMVFGGDVAWGEFALYWIGPLLGGTVAALIYDFVARPRQAGLVTEDVER
ncbi:MAG: MIP family channel protein [Pseudonocardiaceae bacterium]|nr:MIP family channel protein [Pseudonocardiaceae bacterium]